ncbi:NADH-quinone oxidoreductase subunit NuoE [Clostridium brassicae]|uniref:NADH-quinone oxidoreductase subunit NuoE n=1 Tax=Clostridium brassicae TaxID=2999072 RepID=A0ABT4D594_9CLOT|nr:NADH-quinone oxidoreductase subunit NuoE [Clostridium brassicae]MCY6957455.1 NADH-quinone oxidoreductase subunit NuoE [Clostridium brassicae]
MKEIKCCCGSNLKDERLEKVQEIIEDHKDVKGALIPVLHEVQRIYGYLPEEALHIVSEKLEVSMSEIYGVATFYSLFTLESKGKHIIKVCMGTACYVKGSQSVMEKLNLVLGIQVGKTTKDGKFTLEAARCLGSCGLAPVMMIDDRVYGKVTPDDVVRILEEYK